ncbi:MAG: copper amine oxidase-like protein, partial [Bacteroidetes bacterium]|nr:copper amine oxidase-like protein [Bacteroidota bacterium]
SSQYSNNYYKINAIISGTAGTVLGTPILDSLMKVNNFIDSVNKGLITTSFKMDIFNINNGYPILFWQDSSNAIITKNVSEIKDSSAKINANILYPNLANIISKGFYYKKGADLNWSIINGIGDTNMYADLTGLIPNTSYEFKAFFVSSLLTTYIGEVLSFKTLHTPAKINTDSATFILTSSATLNGRIIRGSEPILTTGFKYKRASATSYLIIYTFDSDTLEADISGLLANTEYTFKAFATTPSDTIYGEDINFITDNNSSLNKANINNPELIIYPNPSIDFTNVSANNISGITKVKIFDNFGREVFNEDFYPINNNFNARINTTNLTKGIYNIILINDGFSQSKKLIVY